MIVNIKDKAKDLYYSNKKSGLKATNSQDAIDEVSSKVDQIAGNQIPQEYLEAAVNEYVNNNSAGFATNVNLEDLDNKLSGEIAEVDSVIYENNNIFEFTLGTISGSSGGFISTQSAMVTGYLSAKKGQKIVFLNDWLGAVGYYSTQAQSGFNGISEVWVKEVIVPSDCFIRITAKNAQGTEIEDLTVSAKNVALQYNLLELQNNGVANVKALGATGDGVSDDTAIIQKALNEYSVVYIPKGEYKITSITLNKHNVLLGDSPSLSILKSDSTDFSVIVPRSADHSVIKNIGVTSGIDIGHTGEASVQDMSVHLNSVYVTGGKGIFIGHRGGLFENCRIGGASQGFYVDGTDNVLSNCVASVIDKHGYATSNANNSFENCKAFCCGMSEWGTGFMIAGAFCRVSNCEAQQNRYENFYLKNTNGSILNGCMSDGAFWNSELTEESQYTNKEFGKLNKGAIFVRNIKNCKIDVSVINGSLFGQTHGIIDYIFTTQKDLGEVKEMSNCNITILSFNRNNYECENSDFIISDYTIDNYFLINGSQYLS